MKERLLLALTVIGFVVPNVCVGIFFAEEGFDISGYFSLWTASTPSTQLLLDLGHRRPRLLRLGRRGGAEGTGQALVGLHTRDAARRPLLGLPLFLWMRERTLGEAIAPQP